MSGAWFITVDWVRVMKCLKDFRISFRVISRCTNGILGENPAIIASLLMVWWDCDDDMMTAFL